MIISAIMDVGLPHLAVMRPVTATTLAVLRRTTVPITGREVARRAHASQPAVLKALRELVENGVVWSQPAGRATLYSLNDEHLLVEAIDLLFDVRARLVKRLAQSLSHWELPPLHVSLFGSAARGDGDAESDIDVLVVRPALDEDGADDHVWEGQLDTMRHEIRLWTGNHAAVVDLCLDDVQRMSRQRHRLIEDVRRDGLLVVGKAVDDLLLYAPANVRKRGVAR